MLLFIALCLRSEVASFVLMRLFHLSGGPFNGTMEQLGSVRARHQERWFFEISLSPLPMRFWPVYYSPFSSRSDFWKMFRRWGNKMTQGLAIGWLGIGMGIGNAEEVKEIVVSDHVTLPKGEVLKARLIVKASHVVIEGNGAVLQGPGQQGDVASLEKAGVGINLEGVVNVTVRGLTARGFATGLHARKSKGLLIEQCDFSHNYHNPGHGWGELPPRGGLVLEEVSHSVIRENKANQVWDALHLIGSSDNLIERNDFSHTSNTCAKLWRSSRNRFLENNFSYGIRLDREAGEVHARDSTCVLIESGSDDNYWFRNDMTHGGDGIFIRVLNGWVSRGNVFVENDTSHANNNCVESWSPGNVWIRNKANHGSYGFWLGGSDQTVLIGNEACYNGLPDGPHQAPEPDFAHGGIVIVNGPSSHTIISGNVCRHNGGGGIVFRGDRATRGEKWKIRHWVVQQNVLEHNRWGIWGRYADDIWLGPNVSQHNAEPDFLQDITNLRRAETTAERAPRAVLRGPSRALTGEPVVFDAADSSDPEGKPLRFRWSVGEQGPSLEGQSVWTPSFDRPGFYRVSLTVDNGTLAALAWRDLIVTHPVEESWGTEQDAQRWQAEIPEGGRNGSRLLFADDTEDAVNGKTSLRITADPYAGEAVTAVLPCPPDQPWSLAEKSRLTGWLRVQNPNLPGFQGVGPVVELRTLTGMVRLQPVERRNRLNDKLESEARWTWSRWEIPLAGGEGWERREEGQPDLSRVTAWALTVDS